jgi:hypothetical protein
MALVQQAMRSLTGRPRRERCSACGRAVPAGQELRLRGAVYHKRCAL